MPKPIHHHQLEKYLPKNYLDLNLVTPHYLIFLGTSKMASLKTRTVRNAQATKRGILGKAAKIYDPLGLIAPLITLQGRINSYTEIVATSCYHVIINHQTSYNMVYRGTGAKPLGNPIRLCKCGRRHHEAEFGCEIRTGQ